MGAPNNRPELLRLMADGPDYDSEMCLPPGKTCADCTSSMRCRALLSRTLTETSCDWHPSRFRERKIIGSTATLAAGPEREG